MWYSVNIDKPGSPAVTGSPQPAIHSGYDYETALKEAQDLGFAEADPTADVEGHDVRAKICLLSKLAFGTTLTNIETRGKLFHFLPGWRLQFHFPFVINVHMYKHIYFHINIYIYIYIYTHIRDREIR